MRGDSNHALPIVAVCLLTVSVTTAADAQLNAEELVVVGAQDNIAGQPHPEDATTPVRVVERDQLSNRMATVADAVASQPSTQIRQTGGVGSFATASIRGSSNDQVQVYLDGMLLNDPMTGGVNLNEYSLHNIERIQIYPSAPPAQFANASIGGVVLMETLQRDAADTTRLTAGAGSFGTRRLGVFQGVGEGRSHGWVAVNRLQSDNDFSYPNKADWFNPRDGGTTKRRNAYVERTDFSIKGGHRFSETLDADVLLQHSLSDEGIPTIQNWPDNEASLSRETTRGQIHIGEKGWHSGKLHSSHRISWFRSDEDFDNRGGFVGVGRSDVETRTSRVGLLNSFSYLLGGHTFTLSSDLSQASYDQDDQLDPEPADERQRRQLVGASSHEWISRNGRWRTQGVVRYFHLDERSDETRPDDTVQRVSDRNSYSSWQLGIGYSPLRNWQVFGNIAQQVRIPSLQERFGEQGRFVGNPDLDPEQGLNLDTTLLTEQSWGGFETTLFWRDLDPSIATTFDARGVGRNVNLKARIYGVEGQSWINLTPNWKLTGNVSAKDSENRSSSVRDREDKKLPGIYHTSFQVGIEWSPGRWNTTLKWRVDDDLYYDSANRLKADQRQRLDATLKWETQWPNGHQTSFRLEGRNLSDELYQDFNRFPAPGRSAFFTVTHRI
ncbi:TonB-dependent receptor [Salicola sp. Rm-C-2C1-2]|uniref:TonB-dependent receptor n=1 Tax=Salicola sp. Rm-C-2C1-2 TaxID=3141321 RepID=UPI0032E4BC50